MRRNRLMTTLCRPAYCAKPAEGLWSWPTLSVLFSSGRGRVGRQWEGGPKRCLGFVAGAVIAGLWAICCAAHAADVPAGCSPVARVVSIQGSLQIQRAGHTSWTWVRQLDTIVCQGDVLHTGPTGRVALLLSPETLFRIQQNSTVSIRQTPDETVVEYTIGDQQAAARTAPNQCGAGYFITRFPKKFRVLTPFINASVEGTEFLVALSCQSATVAVFEGRVLAHQILAADSTAFTLNGGEQVTVGGAEPPAVKLVVKPADAVQWALYYPPLTPPAGDEVADQQCNQADSVERGQCILQRAEQRLRMGRVEEAEADLKALTAITPTSGEPYAQRSIIRVVKNDKAEALALAERATQLSPDSSRAWIALSYAHQAAFELKKALDAARKGASLALTSSTAQARVAELLMSLGRIADAEKAARSAVAANADDSRAHMVLGFVHLAQINTKAAQEDFAAAIERDSSDPLPRLGLGLAIIRDGDLKAGREQIEIAVVLDPTNSLIRSYMGKAYYEENTSARDALAETQFGLAADNDPKDPTPWFYNAILQGTRNRPVDAVADLQRSIELNENRAVYRSQPALDQDLGTRLVSLAASYRDVGFEQLALIEASKSLLFDSHSYVSNYFLAESYEGIPRAERTGESQLLQAMLRSPIGIIPVSPFRGPAAAFPSTLPRAGVVRSVGPVRTAFAEYTPLFDRPGARFYLDALVASQDTVADQAIAAGAWDNVSISVGQGYFRTDGFEPDRSLHQNAWNGFFQVRATDQVYLQAELSESRSDRTVVAFDFDPAGRLPLQVTEEISTLRFGGRYEYGPRSQFLLNASTQEYDEVLSVGGLDDPLSGKAYSIDAQYSFSDTRFGVTLGASNWEGEQTFTASATTEKATFNNGYIYTRFSDPSRIALMQAAVTYASEEVLGSTRTRASPKLGAMVTPLPGTTLRFAAFDATRRQTVANQTLEPTQIAGFNQYWDDGVGSSSQQYGVGLDQRFGRNVFVGVEYMKRDIEVPLFLPAPVDFEWEERLGRAYAYLAIPRRGDRKLLPTWSGSLSMDVFYEHLQRPEVFAPEGVVDLDTYVVPLAVRFFPNGWLSAKLGATYVRQAGDLQNPPELFDVDTDFWTVDFSLDFRLPRRHGKLTLGVSNLFDEQTPFTTTSLVSTRFAPERVAFARLTLVLP